MADLFIIKQNDRRESIKRTLKDSAVVAINLTGATVKFIMKATPTGTAKVNAAAVVVGPAVDGVVQYNWAAGDTDTAGLFLAEFEVTFADATKHSFPNDGYIEVRVIAELG